MQEEMSSQQPQYEQFITTGLAIVDRCDPDSKDAEEINGTIEEVGIIFIVY